MFFKSRNKCSIKFKLICSIACLAVSAGLILLAKSVSGFAEWYSASVYDAIVGIVGRITGIVPFSVVEILLYIFIVRIIYRIISLLLKKYTAAEFLSSIVLISSVLFSLYVVNCGIHYHRVSFAESSDLILREYTVDQLETVCTILTEDLNECADLVERDESGVMVHKSNLHDEVKAAMYKLSEDYPQLQGYYPQPKRLLFPWILSVQQITGIYSPFTVEANYNNALINYNIPFSACHELSHLRGYMQEEEANFIAWLACMKSDNIDFQYSGTMRGWISCMNLLYRNDQESWKNIRLQLNEKVEADLTANSLFWDQYEGKIAEYAEKVNDTYLKANGQADGIKSYSRMADLIVAYYIQN